MKKIEEFMMHLEALIKEYHEHIEITFVAGERKNPEKLIGTNTCAVCDSNIIQEHYRLGEIQHVSGESSIDIVM